MASGKTTLAKKVEYFCKDIFVSFEDISFPTKKVKSLNLNKYKKEDYFEIQRIFINSEVERYYFLKKKYHKVLFDLGAEELEFYTLFFPKAIGENWDVEENLADELRALRECMSDKIFFLDLPLDFLIKQKEKDFLRKRSFFDFYIKNLHSLKVEWFKSQKNVEFLKMDILNDKQVLNIIESSFRFGSEL